MTKPWPPPPDLESIKELVRNADTEELIAIGFPDDEYDGELHATLANFATADLIVPNILPRIEAIWSRSFDYDDVVLVKIRPHLEKLAQQIERFFGPQAESPTRGRS